MSSPYYDPENQLASKENEFFDQMIRRGFIRKVYSVLSIQLLITFGFISCFVYQPDVNSWARENRQYIWYAFAAVFIIIIALGCCEGLRRAFPCNLIFLGMFTVAESFVLGMTCAWIKSEIVLMAVGTTAVVCFALTIFAFQTKYDFTILGGGLCVCLIAMMIFGIVAIIFPGKIIFLVFGSVGALLFSIYLIYDTQLMMGGNHRYAISPEEYIFAALNLYTDIIQLFLHILTIFRILDE